MSGFGRSDKNCLADKEAKHVEGIGVWFGRGTFDTDRSVCSLCQPLWNVVSLIDLAEEGGTD